MRCYSFRIREFWNWYPFTPYRPTTMRTHPCKRKGCEIRTIHEPVYDNPRNLESVVMVLEMDVCRRCGRQQGDTRIVGETEAARFVVHTRTQNNEHAPLESHDIVFHIRKPNTMRKSLR